MQWAVDAWYYPNPLNSVGRVRTTMLVEDGTTIEKLRSGIAEASAADIVFCDGMAVKPDHAVRNNCVVSFHKSAQDPVSTLAFFFLDVGLFVGYEIAVASFLVSAGTALAVNAVVSTVFAPDKPNISERSYEDVPNAYSVSAANNGVRGYQPLPLVMGTVRFAPDIDARPWTQFVEDPQNIRQQTVVQTVNQEGHAAYYACDDNGCSWADTGQPMFNTYPTDPIQYGYATAWTLHSTGIYVASNYGYVSQTSTDYRSLYYQVSSGKYGKTPSGPWTTFEEARPSYTFTQNVTGAYPETTQELTEYFNFGLGDLTITDERLGQTEITQFNGLVSTRASMYSDSTVFDTTAHPTPPYAGNTWKTNVLSVAGGELRQNANVADSGWVKREYYGDDAEYVQVDISGRLYYSGNSGIENSSCAIEGQFSTDGGGSWSPGFSVTLTNGDSFPVRQTFGWAVTPGTPIQVRVRKITTDSTDARLTQDFEFVQAKFFRPEVLDAANPLSLHPAQNRYAIAVRAGGQINGTIENLNALVTAKCWVWTGAGTNPSTAVGGVGWTWQTTENPAYWYLYYAMGGFRKSVAPGWCTGPETADGPRLFGAGLRQERLDLESIVVWAAFCTSYNLRFNAVLKDQSNVSEILIKIARIGRASPTWRGGKLGVVWEDPLAVPVANFGMPSIVRDSLSISYIGYNSPEEIIATYTEPDDEWREKEVRKVVPGVVLPNSETQITLWGCKYEEQAQREANLLAARQFYQRRRVSFETSQEGLPICRGDVILLSHDMTNWAVSGRLTEGSAGNVLQLVRRLDPIPDPGGGTNVLDVVLVKPDGTRVTGNANRWSAPTDTITTTNMPAINFSEFPDAVPEDWVLYISEDSEVGKRMRVAGVEPGNGRNIRITCTDERVEMWQYENSGTPSVIGDSEEVLAMKVQDLSVNRDPCTGNVCVSWEAINCRKVLLGVSVNGGAVGYVNVVGQQLCLGILPEGTSLAISATPVADAGTQAISFSISDSLAVETDAITPINTCPMPSVEVLSATSATAGTYFSATLALTHATTATITNLPAGLSQSGAASGTGYVITVAGTPTTAGTTALLVNATNACGGGLNAASVTGFSGGTLAISAAPVVCPSPSVGLLLSTSATAGTYFSTTMTIFSATTAAITNLPAGLSQSGAASGANYVITVTGTPTIAGSTPLLVNATNACGGGSTATSVTGQGSSTLVVASANACPTPDAIWWSPPPVGKVGTAFSGTLLIGDATSATITNLPAGLSQSGAIVEDGNYLITVTGTPTTAGDVAILVNAVNACGGGFTTSSASGIGAGTFVINPLLVDCPTPYAGSWTGKTGAATIDFDETLTVINATSATITNLPSWATQTGAPHPTYPNWYTIRVQGTPPTPESTDLLINATNACGGGSNTSSVTGEFAGTLLITPLLVNCDTPQVGQLTALTGQVGVYFSATITILNATTATINNTIPGLSWFGTASGSDYIISLQGTPTTAKTQDFRVDATNVCNGGANSTSVGNVSAGTLVISP